MIISAGVIIGIVIGIIDIYIPSSILISTISLDIDNEDLRIGFLLGHSGISGLGRIIHHRSRADMIYMNEDEKEINRKELGLGIGNYMTSKTLVILGVGIFGSINGVGVWMRTNKDSVTIWIISICIICIILIPYVLIQSKDKVSTVTVMLIGLGIGKYLLSNNANPMIVMFLYLYSITGPISLLKNKKVTRRIIEVVEEDDENQGWAWFSGIIGSTLISIPPTLLLSMHHGGSRYRMGCTCTGVSEGMSISMYILLGSSRDSLSTNIGRNTLSNEQGIVLLLILLCIMWMNYSLFLRLYLRSRNVNRRPMIVLSIVVNYIGSLTYVSFIESIILILLNLIIHREIRRTGMMESSMGILMLIPILGR